MKVKALLLLVNLVLISSIVFAQCEVKKVTLKEGLDRYSMTENLLESEDYENGLQSVYFSVNYYGDKSDKSKPKVVTMVVTYAWTGNRTRIVPNTIFMKLPSGKGVALFAEEKSTGTLEHV